MAGYKRAEGEWYVEPDWFVDQLLNHERFIGTTWDPACGGGNIPDRFRARKMRIVWSDLVNRGYPNTLAPHDFLTEDVPYKRGVDNIVTNPPFGRAILARAFIERALPIARHKVAASLPVTYLASEGRYSLFTGTPLARVWISSKRPSMPPGGLDIEPDGGKVDFAWYVWEHGWHGPAQLLFLPPSEVDA